MATKKAAASRTSAAKVARKAPAKSAPKSMPKAGRNPQGGLTEAGRKFFAKLDGLHLKPGVTGPADTPEKMKRKGSFLVRTFTHPRGPMIDLKGQPTRLALSAHAWGEKVPKTVSAAHTLAAKGHQLLSKYHAQQEKAAASKSPRTKARATKNTAANAATTKASAKKSTGSAKKGAAASSPKPKARKQ